MSGPGQITKRGRLLLCCLILQGLLAARCYSQSRVERIVHRIAASPAGSEVIVVLEDDGSETTPTVYAISTASGKVLWSRNDLPLLRNAAFSPDGKLVALAMDHTPQDDSVAQIVDGVSGKVLQKIRQADAPGYFPSATSEVLFAPDGSLLYGLGEQYLFAWDIQAHKLLWTREVPGGPPDTQRDTATSFALSPDGGKLGLNRFGLVYLLPAGRTKPGKATTLPGNLSNVGDQPAFSPDSRYFATGYGYNSSFSSSASHYARGGFLWRLDGSKPRAIASCGGYFAWTADTNVFACGNYAGTHLRDVRAPSVDVGAAGPISDVPFVTVGHSLWVAAYKVQDWKDPKKALPLTLVEIGTGKRVTLTVPGRSGTPYP